MHRFFVQAEADEYESLRGRWSAVLEAAEAQLASEKVLSYF